MPDWPAPAVEYAAQQLSWHVNVVSYAAESPIAAVAVTQLGGSGGSPRGCARACVPANMMYAEMAASIIAAAETEAAAADADLLPGAPQFLGAVARVLSRDAKCAQPAVQGAWDAAAAAGR
jgi:hypothetical protein